MIAHICRKLIGICVLFTLNIKFILFFCSFRNRILRIVFPCIVVYTQSCNNWNRNRKRSPDVFEFRIRFSTMSIKYMHFMVCSNEIFFTQTAPHTQKLFNFSELFNFFPQVVFFWLSIASNFISNFKTCCCLDWKYCLQNSLDQIGKKTPP